MKLILIALLMITLGSCTPWGERQKLIPVVDITGDTGYVVDTNPNDCDEIQCLYRIEVIDSCEYISYALGLNGDGLLTHKGNCKYCKQRKP